MTETEIPGVIAIARRKGGPTENIGHLPDGRQFMAFLVQVPDGWMPVVHHFTGEGAYLESEHDAPVPGEGDEPPARAREAFQKMLRRLEPCQWQTVTIAPFETEVAHCRFGLIPDREAGTLTLIPAGLVFGPPWNGDSAR